MPDQPTRTSATERNPVPAADVDRLQELRLAVLDTPSNRQVRAELDLLCAQLLRRGYTQQAVATALDVTREAVRQRVNRVPEEQLAGIEPEVSRRVEKPEPVRPVKPRLTADELAELTELHPLARMRRGPRSRDPLVAAASAEFNRILIAAAARGVTPNSMAANLGLSPAAVSQRLARLNGTLPPSMRPVEREPQPNPLIGFEEQVRRLGELLVVAAANRSGARSAGSTPPARIASQEANRILLELVDGHGVPATAIARALDREPSGLLHRLGRARAAASVTPTAGTGGDTGRPDAAGELDGDLTDVAAGREGDDLKPPAGCDAGDRGVSLGLAGEHKFDDEDLDGDPEDDEAAGRPAVRTGWLTDFVEETTPSAPSERGQPSPVDPGLRDERTAEHHAAVRRLRRAAAAAGHATSVWDVGQDAAFVVAGRLVNVEVKTAVGAGAAGQYRLGIGQLQEQVENHLANAELGVDWYAVSGAGSVVPVLVVDTPAEIPPLWRRIADRLQMLILDTAAAETLFGGPDLFWLPPGVPFDTAALAAAGG